ncbi:MAG: tetratricopeptide repeat protein, partial [Oligoflexia bacterium]|nr:tetratricopeptide repeat protein [Oligoflexia bacterium]
IPGTAIGEAILQSVKAFDKSDKQSRVLILITDGEDHLADPLEAAKRAQAEGVKIYTIGIGQEGGAPIPDGEHGGFKKNAQGEVILSTLNEEVLQKIALTTGGSYVRSVSGDLDLEKIYADIHKSVEEKELKSGKQKRFEERFQWPLLLAIVLLILETFFSERKQRLGEKMIGEFKRFGQRFKNNRNLGIVILLFVVVPTSSFAWDLFAGKAQKGASLYQGKKYEEALRNFTDAQIDAPKDEKIKYNMANTYYKMGKYEEAEKLYQSISQGTDVSLAEKSFYNLGNNAYRQGKLQQAVEYYQEALRLDPNDEDAKYNLEFVRNEIKRRIEENKKREEQQKNKQQDKQQDKQQQGQNNKQCPNPSAGGGAGAGKEGKQDTTGKQGENKQEGNKQEENKQAENKKDGDKAQQQAAQQAAAAQQQQQKQEQKQQGQQAAAPQGAAPQEGAAAGMPKKEGTPTPEEMEAASRWLSNLEENRKKFLRGQMPSDRKYRVEKDW